jgi:hypothetical protein
MRIIRGQPVGAITGAIGFIVWWLPELGTATALVAAGAFAWWPLGVAAVVPLIRPARDALVQVNYAQLERQVRYLEAAAVDAERGKPGTRPPRATATRLDRSAALEAGGSEQK